MDPFGFSDCFNIHKSILLFIHKNFPLWSVGFVRSAYRKPASSPMPGFGPMVPQMPGVTHYGPGGAQRAPVPSMAPMPGVASDLFRPMVEQPGMQGGGRWMVQGAPSQHLGNCYEEGRKMHLIFLGVLGRY